jgi:hypothetical protein
MYAASTFITLAVYNTIAFVAPFNRGCAGFWIGYGFSTLAILLSSGIGLYALGREGIKSKFYGMPLADAARIYLIIQMLAGFAEMGAASLVPYQAGLILNVAMLGVFLVGVMAVSAATGEIERLDEEVKGKVFYIKSLQADIEGLAGGMPDDSIKKLLKDLAETVRYSDPMSSPQLAAVENKIEAKASALAEAADKADNDAVKALCDELQQLFGERNRKCKILK